MTSAGARTARTGARAAAAAAVSAVCALLLVPGFAAAATFPVTKQTDSADGTCDADCSLREAVIAANAAPGDDVILLDAGRYELTIAGAGEDASATGDLDNPSGEGLDVRGAGSAQTTIDANSLDRVFDINGDGSRVELRGATLTGGASGLENGGAVRNDDGSLRGEDVRFVANTADDGGAVATDGSGDPAVRLDDAAFLDNTATGNVGGGAIFSQEGPVTISDAVFAGNRLTDPTPIGGGAIFNQNDATMTLTGVTIGPHSAPSRAGAIMHQNDSTLTISDSVIEGASSGDDGAGIYVRTESVLTIADSTLRGGSTAGAGGALAAEDASLVSIIDSTLADNEADSDGGAILGFDEAQITVLRSTINGNDAGGNGGGIAISGILESARALVLNSTLSGNTAVADGGGVYVEPGGGAFVDSSTIAANAAAGGGGIASNALSTDAFELTQSIVAGNEAPANPACSGSFGSRGGNLFDTSCTPGAAGDLQNANAALGQLADNGGPTRTHALTAGSAAIDAVEGNCNRATDQRGIARPQGGACDIGAFELIQAFGADAGVNFSKLPKKANKRGFVKVTVSNTNPFTVTGELTLKAKKKKLAKSNVELAGGETEKLKLRLSKKGRKAAAKKGKLKGTAKLVLSDPSGGRATVTERFKLK